MTIFYKVRQSKFFVFFIFTLAISLLFVNCKSNTPNQRTTSANDILTAPISNLNVIKGTRIKVFLSAIDDHLENVNFTCLDCPPFIFLSKNKNGNATLTIDANEKADKNISIKIQTQNGENSTTTSLNISFTKHEGKIYYCQPNESEARGKGTKESPFSSLEKIMESSFVPEENALFLLLNGFHGAPTISKNNIIIAAATGNDPQLSAIHLKNASDVMLSGLNIGSYHADQFFPKNYMVMIDSSCANINIQNCIIETHNETAEWQPDDWNAKAGSGIKCRAKNSVIQNNLIRNVFHGVKIENSNIRVQYNTVDRFSGDAIRNTGSNNRFSFNLLKNAVLDDYYDPKGNHDDLFQSWTFDAPIENIRLNNNIAISCLEPNLPLKSKVVQGLVCFDGFEKNWLVENNLVITDHPHGIALFGAENCQVIHNKVLRNPLHLFDFESAPWIMINNHKDGRKSKNCEVSDNIVSALNITSKDVLKKNNTIVKSDSVDIFIDYAGWDFGLKEK